MFTMSQNISNKTAGFKQEENKLCFCTEAFNLMPVRPEAFLLPAHEYSNEKFNLFWEDYWKAAEARTVVPQACFKPR